MTPGHSSSLHPRRPSWPWIQTRPPFWAIVDYWCVALAGAWLAASPSLFDYPAGAPQITSDRLTGGFLMLAAPAASFLAVRFHWLGWACSAAGAWVLLSLLVFQGQMLSSLVFWNEACAGAIAFELAGWATDAATQHASSHEATFES